MNQISRRMNWTGGRRGERVADLRSCLATLCALLLSSPVSALGSVPQADSLLRTHFTPEDGLPGTVIDQIAQTRDGFLWLIDGSANLDRFDGTRFHQFALRPSTMAVAPDGDLWVGAGETLTRIPQSAFTRFRLSGLTQYHLDPGAGDIHRLHWSRSGALWLGTATGLYLFRNGQFVAVGPRVSTHTIEETPDGHLLVVNRGGFLELADTEVVPHPELEGRLGVRRDQVFQVLIDSHGNTWYSTAYGLLRDSAGRLEQVGPYGLSGQATTQAYEDARGTVWIAKESGLFRVVANGLESVAPGLQVRSFFNDRDGDLWVGTNGDGLYRFRQPPVRMFTSDDGLPGDVIMTVLVAHDGTLWTGANCGGISQFDGTRFHTYSEKDGLLNSCVWALAEDAQHDLWIGTWGGGAFRYHDGRFTQYSTGQGLIDDRVTNIVAARDGAVWLGTRGGLTRVKDGELRNFTTADGLSRDVILSLFQDRAGVIWIGSRRGIDRFVGDRFERFTRVADTLATPIGQDRDGGVFVANYPEPTLRFAGDRVDTIPGLPEPWDMLETAGGDLWFGGAGIGRVPAGSLLRSRPHDAPLDFQVISSLDGLASTEVSGATRTLARTGDGALWVATPRGLARIDTGRLPVRTERPSIYLTGLTIGRNTGYPSGDVILPPGTSHLRLDFSAIDISAPEKIQMQYRLDDVDREWLDAGPDRRAVYSTLPPGPHQLHIRASNRSGVWDRDGVVFTIRQVPFFYQTRLFDAAMLVLGGLLVWAFYRLWVRRRHLREVAALKATLAERARIARDLHDTLLQGFTGLTLRIDGVRGVLEQQASPMAQDLSHILLQADQTLREARDMVWDIRGDATHASLAEALERGNRALPNPAGVALHHHVGGLARPLSPTVAGILLRIGREATSNALRHAEAQNIVVRLTYGPRRMTLEIRDDGTGADPRVLEEASANGHWGVSGMRERARGAGGTLTIHTAPGKGTRVVVDLPSEPVG